MTRDVSLVIWAALFAAVLALEFSALVIDDRLPTAGDVASFLMHPRVGRWMVLLGWLWLGWHLFVRASGG